MKKNEGSSGRGFSSKRWKSESPFSYGYSLKNNDTLTNISYDILSNNVQRKISFLNSFNCTATRCN